MRPRIATVMDLSTDHLRPYQRVDLPSITGVIAYSLTNREGEETGLLLWVPPADEDAETAAWRADSVPVEIQTVIAYARHWGCAYVRFDLDAGMVDGLPVYS